MKEFGKKQYPSNDSENFKIYSRIRVLESTAIERL